MKAINPITAEWLELIWHAKYEYPFDKPMDETLFKTCMKDAFEYFFIDRDKEEKVLNQLEMRLYGIIYAYSNIPVLTEGDNTIVFKASLQAADALAEAILWNRAIDNYTLITGERIIDGESIKEEYNFETGDLSNYIKIVESENGS